jgi:hypothetical protein
MALIAPERNPSLHLLMDNLDAALTTGEDLLAQELALDGPDGSGLRGWMRHTRNLSGFVASVRTLEYAMMARLLQARRRADDLRRDSRLKPVLAMFVAGTVPLVEAAAELGDTEARGFDSTDATLTFLRSRGLIAGDAAGLDLVDRLAVDEAYLVAGRIPLGTLLDLVATFLDTLDRLYDLRGESLRTADLPALPRTMGLSAEPGAAN